MTRCSGEYGKTWRIRQTKLKWQKQKQKQKEEKKEKKQRERKEEFRKPIVKK